MFCSIRCFVSFAVFFSLFCSRLCFYIRCFFVRCFVIFDVLYAVLFCNFADLISLFCFRCFVSTLKGRTCACSRCRGCCWDGPWHRSPGSPSSIQNRFLAINICIPKKKLPNPVWQSKGSRAKGTLIIWPPETLKLSAQSGSIS